MKPLQEIHNFLWWREKCIFLIYNSTEFTLPLQRKGKMLSSEEILERTRLKKPRKANSKFFNCTSNVQGLRWLFPTSSADCKRLVLLSSKALLGRYLIALTTQISGGLHHNLGFSFTVKINSLSGPSWRESLIA